MTPKKTNLQQSYRITPASLKAAKEDDNQAKSYLRMLTDEVEYDSERVKNLEFHIQLNDYLGTIATILDLIKQEKEEMKQRNEEIDQRHGQILKNLSNDLVYLQKHYHLDKLE